MSQQLSTALAAHLRAVFFGGNWTTVNVKDVLSDVPVEHVHLHPLGPNSILRLTYHIAYYVRAQISVFENKGLHASDDESYSHPDVVHEDDWRSFVQHILTDVELLANHIELLDEDTIWGNFVDQRYGSVFRNIVGMIEHTHYHLGQIVLIKKYLSTVK